MHQNDDDPQLGLITVVGFLLDGMKRLKRIVWSEFAIIIVLRVGRMMHDAWLLVSSLLLSCDRLVLSSLYKQVTDVVSPHSC